MAPALLDRKHHQPRFDGMRTQEDERPWEARSQRLSAMRSAPESRVGESSELTLDDLITGIWEGLVVCHTACCPACGGTMASESGAEDGACGSCGARLS
jgi:hypothetical protein